MGSSHLAPLDVQQAWWHRVRLGMPTGEFAAAHRTGLGWPRRLYTHAHMRTATCTGGPHVCARWATRTEPACHPVLPRAPRGVGGHGHACSERGCVGAGRRLARMWPVLTPHRAGRVLLPQAPLPEVRTADCSPCPRPSMPTHVAWPLFGLCGRCGGIFCAQCSTNRRPLPKLGHNEPVRVCDACAVKEDARIAHLPPSRPTVASAALSADILASLQLGAASPSSPLPGSPLSVRTDGASTPRSPTKTPRRRRKKASRDDGSGVDKEARADSIMEVVRRTRERYMTVWCWPLSHCTAVYGRRYLLRHTALEVRRATCMALRRRKRG